MKGSERISPGLGLILRLLPLLRACTRMGCVTLGTGRGSFGGCLGSTTVLLSRRLRLGRLGSSVGRCLSARGICLRRPVNFAVAGAQSISVILEPLMRVTEDFISRLNGLEPGNEVLFLARVPVRVIFEC